MCSSGGAGAVRRSVEGPDDHAVGKMERFIFVVEDWSRVEGEAVVAVLSIEVVPLRHVFSSSEVMLGIAYDTSLLHAE